MTPQDLLAAYDGQLRRSEVAGARSVSELGPLLLAVFPGGQGFITYRDLDGLDAASIADLVSAAREHFRAMPEIDEVEWKTRGHDSAPGLDQSLRANGFQPEEPESIMIGEAALLAVDVPLPAGVTLRVVREPADIEAMIAMQDSAFERSLTSTAYRDELVARAAADSGEEFWVAEAGGEVVSAGRLTPVAGTDFAGIWGGATLPHWRGRGIYRALTAARARSAIAQGKRYINSDSTEFSRPILERSGLVKVSTTTPYRWVRS